MLQIQLKFYYYSGSSNSESHFQVLTFQVQVQLLNFRVQIQVQVLKKPDSSPTRVQVQESSPTTLLFTGLKCLNKLNIKSSLSLTKFSIPLSLRICMTSYLFSLLTVTTHALHLMSLWSNHHHHSKSLIDPSDMLHFIFGTSFLHHSEFLIRIIHPPLSDLHFNMPV